MTVVAAAALAVAMAVVVLRIQEPGRGNVAGVVRAKSRISGGGGMLLASFEIDVLVGELPIDWRLPRARTAHSQLTSITTTHRQHSGHDNSHPRLQ